MKVRKNDYTQSPFVYLQPCDLRVMTTWELFKAWRPTPRNLKTLAKRVGHFLAIPMVSMMALFGWSMMGAPLLYLTIEHTNGKLADTYSAVTFAFCMVFPLVCLGRIFCWTQHEL